MISLEVYRNNVLMFTIKEVPTAWEAHAISKRLAEVPGVSTVLIASSGEYETGLPEGEGPSPDWDLARDMERGK